MVNLITEPISTSIYHSEYVNTVLKYKMQIQKGIFIRYYNVNVSASSNASNTRSVMDSYGNLIYDVYEYTPIWEVDDITDNAEDNAEANGLMFQGVSSITIHSIQYPRINDIVNFVYAPYTNDHAYRVKNISTMLSARDSGLYLFKLELENAFNVSQLSHLNISNSYVYSMYDNKNILRTQYESIMSEQSIISNALSNLLFDQYYELYYYVGGSGNKIAPLEANKSIYDSLSKNNIRQYFSLNISNTVQIPYGVNNYATIIGGFYDFTTATILSDGTTVLQSSISTVIRYVSSSQDLIIQDCAKLLTLFQG